jgi:hypothetical protein
MKTVKCMENLDPAFAWMTIINRLICFGFIYLLELLALNRYNNSSF